MIEVEGQQLEIVAVVAMARNHVIGRDGEMPWRLPSDAKRYRRLTMGRPMIMGHKTLQSIGRVLDGRDTVVLTRSKGVAFADALVAASPQAALAAAARCAIARGTNEIVIAGGAQIYAIFLDQTDRLEVTLIDAEPAGDAQFPMIDDEVWIKIAEEPMARTERDSADARFVTYRRTGSSVGEGGPRS